MVFLRITDVSDCLEIISICGQTIIDICNLKIFFKTIGAVLHNALNFEV